ncbi:acyltransferase family protein [Pseudomaricurvus hydrocarbonicus]
MLFFHGGLFGVTGGYVGVDVFFVISGYLITSILINEIEGGQFSILSFYERRARRILPALAVVLIAATIAAVVFMPSDFLKDYSKSLVSVVTFSSNVYFYLTNGYFSTAADEKPLLHTWSLAVEEQYYIFFPVLLSLLWFMGRKNLILFIFSVAILSLLFAQYQSSQQMVDANFYLIFSRAWELFFGALVALVGVQRLSIGSASREILGGLGLVLIFYSILFFDKHTPFPSVYTLIPVLGTMLIISFSNSTTLIGKLLSHRLLVGIGLISYSLYLWHQPIFAFLRMKTVGEPGQYLFMLAIVAAIILSAFTYHYVEKPFRNRNAISRKKIFQLSSATIGVFLMMGLSGYYWDGFKGRIGEPLYLDTAQFSPKRKTCHTKGHDYLKPENACQYFGSDVAWASFGDSHIVEPTYALAQLLDRDDKGLLHLSFSGCPPALLFEVNRPSCSKWVNEALAFLESEDAIKHVLLGFRYSAFLYGDQLDHYPDIPNEDPVDEFTHPQENADLREVYWHSFSEIVRRLMASNKKVYVLYPIPELPVHISKAVSPFSIFGSQTMIDLDSATTSQYYFERNQFILKKLDALPYGENLHAIKPFDILCNKVSCPAVKRDVALYFDDDHLSVEGARLLLEGSALARDLKQMTASRNVLK